MYLLVLLLSHTGTVEQFFKEIQNVSFVSAQIIITKIEENFGKNLGKEKRQKIWKLNLL